MKSLVHNVGKTLLVVGLLVSSVVAPAHASGPYILTNTTIKTILVSQLQGGSASEILFVPAAAIQDAGPMGSPCSSVQYIRVLTSGTTWSQQYQAVLSAYLSGRAVDLHIEGCTYYPVLSQITLR